MTPCNKYHNNRAKSVCMGESWSRSCVQTSLRSVCTLTPPARLIRANNKTPYTSWWFLLYKCFLSLMCTKRQKRHRMYKLTITMNQLNYYFYRVALRFSDTLYLNRYVFIHFFRWQGHRGTQTPWSGGMYELVSVN